MNMRWKAVGSMVVLAAAFVASEASAQTTVTHGRICTVFRWQREDPWCFLYWHVRAGDPGGFVRGRAYPALLAGVGRGRIGRRQPDCGAL